MDRSSIPLRPVQESPNKIERGDGLLAAQSSKLGVCMLAAGIAKRLEPISAIIAKPAFPLAGRIPIAELWVRKFVEAGVPTLSMNLHRVPESIRGYFGDGAAFGADITYVYEPEPSGTLGGAIKMVRALQQKGLHPQRVFIPSGDIVSEIGEEQLQEMVQRHVKSGAAFTVMLAPVPWERRVDYGTVVLEGIAPNLDVAPGTYARIDGFLEKVADSPSNENNASNYLVETDFLLELEPYLTEAKVGVEEPCYDFGKHVLTGMTGKVPHLGFLARRGRDLYGYEPGRLWFDVGQKRDYLEVNRAALDGAIGLELPYRKTEWGWMGEGVQMQIDRVTIEPPVIIGDRCTIAPGAVIGPYACISEGWEVKERARIRDAVLWPHYHCSGIAADAASEVGEGVVVDTAIVAGGRIRSDLREQTAHPQADGQLQVTDIDWAPGGERA